MLKEDLHKAHGLTCEGHPPRRVEEVEASGKIDLSKGNFID